MPARERRGSRRWLHSRPVVASVVLVLLAAAWMSWLYATADAKIAPDLLIGTGPKDLTVQLRFPPEKFHMLLLQELGRIQSVNRSTVQMLDVPPERIRAFARHYWVASIDARDRTNAVTAPPSMPRH